MVYKLIRLTDSIMIHQPMTNKWDKRFFQAAKIIAQWSPDPSSKVGAIAVSEQNLPLTWGWNAFPRSYFLKENEVSRELKYKHIVHAEMNAIYNSSRESVCLMNSTFYIYGIPPCFDCAKGLLQVGVKKVKSLLSGDVDKKWLDSYDESVMILEPAGITCEIYHE